MAGVRCRAQGEEFRGEDPDPAAVTVLRGADQSVPPEPGQRAVDGDAGDSEEVGEFALTAGERDVAVGSVPAQSVQEPGREAGLARVRGGAGGAGGVLEVDPDYRSTPGVEVSAIRAWAPIVGA